MSCTGVKPGDAAFWVVNPPDEAAMLALVNIPGTVGSLFLTDRAWNGTDLVGLEGVMEVCREKEVDALYLIHGVDETPCCWSPTWGAIWNLW